MLGSPHLTVHIVFADKHSLWVSLTPSGLSARGKAETGNTRLPHPSLPALSPSLPLPLLFLIILEQIIIFLVQSLHESLFFSTA